MVRKDTWNDFSLLKFVDLSYDLVCDLSWRMLQVPLRRMSILPLLGEMFCECLSGLTGIVLFKSAVSLLIFCLDDLFIIESGILKSPTIVLYLSMCAFYVYGWSDIEWIYIYNCHIFLFSWLFYHYVMNFVSCDNFSLKVYFIWHNYSHPYSLLVNICKEFFPIFSL